MLVLFSKLKREEDWLAVGNLETKTIGITLMEVEIESGECLVYFVLLMEKMKNENAKKE